MSTPEGMQMLRIDENSKEQTPSDFKAELFAIENELT
jgi:hypothetical protein